MADKVDGTATDAVIVLDQGAMGSSQGYSMAAAAEMIASMSNDGSWNEPKAEPPERTIWPAYFPPKPMSLKDRKKLLEKKRSKK